MKIVQDSFGQYLNTSYRKGYCELPGNEIADYHGIKSSNNTP